MPVINRKRFSYPHHRRLFFHCRRRRQKLRMPGFFIASRSGAALDPSEQFVAIDEIAGKIGGELLNTAEGFFRPEILADIFVKTVPDIKVIIFTISFA